MMVSTKRAVCPGKSVQIHITFLWANKFAEPRLCQPCWIILPEQTQLEPFGAHFFRSLVSSMKTKIPLNFRTRKCFSSINLYSSYISIFRLSLKYFMVGNSSYNFESPWFFLISLIQIKLENIPTLTHRCEVGDLCLQYKIFYK